MKSYRPECLNKWFDRIIVVVIMVVESIKPNEEENFSLSIDMFESLRKCNKYTIRIKIEVEYWWTAKKVLIDERLTKRIRGIEEWRVVR